ncbi:hypothetical protein [Acinetobacter sp.]|nr:hypothetical protein [Acinetobacter sp.]MDI1221678.1 hypothetical protein [Acinetobacter sp.]
MFRRIVIFLASLLFLLNSALVNAVTINGWNLLNPTAVGGSILYDATKGPVSSSVLITPNASQVAKVLRGGVAGIALSFAVEQLLGALDWVFDPTNNRVKYKEKIVNPLNYYTNYMDGKFHPTAFQACEGLLAFSTDYNSAKFYPSTLADHYDCVLVMSNGNTSAPTRVSYVKNAPDTYEEKTLSLITAAQQVIENAESDNLDAQFTVLATATNILSEAEQDDAKAKPIADELDNSSKCPSGIVRNGSCWVCDKSLFMPYTRTTRDAKNATRGKSCKNVTDTTVKAANATLFRNLINARVQENACWLPPDPNHAIALIDAQNALSLCEN